MATFSTTASYGSSLEQKTRYIECKFGEGYEQAVQDGINSEYKVWSLTFSNVSPTTATTIMDFFRTNSTATTPFDWTDPDGVAGRYKCKEPRRTYDTFGAHNVTCVFEEVFF